MEKCVGTVLPHLRGKGLRMTFEKVIPGGRKRSPRGVKFRPPGVLNPWFVASGGLPGRLGRQVRLRRAV